MYQTSLLELPRQERDVASLSDFDGRRFAVLIVNGSSHLALQGIARYVDDTEGSVLRIEADNESQFEQGHPIFVIREDAWDGRFVPDYEYGCDFQLRLDAGLVRN